MALEGENLLWSVLWQDLEPSARAPETLVPGEGFWDAWSYQVTHRAATNGSMWQVLVMSVVFHHLPLWPFAAWMRSFLFLFYIIRYTLPACITCMCLDSHNIVPEGSRIWHMAEHLLWSVLVYSTEGLLMTYLSEALLSHLEYCSDLILAQLLFCLIPAHPLHWCMERTMASLLTVLSWLLIICGHMGAPQSVLWGLAPSGLCPSL